MKKFNLTSLIMLFVAVTAMAQTSGQDEPKKTIEITPAGAPVMTFDVDEYNFGKIVTGEVVTHVFTFVNTGDAPLVIEKTARSCGCTTPSYSKEPVMPGDTGQITVQFNSMGKMGAQAKTVTIHYNNVEKSPAVIIIKSMVIEKKD